MEWQTDSLNTSSPDYKDTWSSRQEADSIINSSSLSISMWEEYAGYTSKKCEILIGMAKIWHLR